MLIHIPQWPFVCTMVAHTLEHFNSKLIIGNQWIILDCQLSKAESFHLTSGWGPLKCFPTTKAKYYFWGLLRADFWASQKIFQEQHNHDFQKLSTFPGSFFQYPMDLGPKYLRFWKPLQKKLQNALYSCRFSETP